MSKDVDNFFDDEVSTGATLESGTTIGSGDEVYHLGNDGLGSGLDADTVRGKNPVGKGKQVERKNIIESTGNKGNILTQFSSPSGNPQGLGVDSNECIWVADGIVGTIFQLNQSGTQLKSFSSPSDLPGGLAVDKNDCIWNTDVAKDSIYQIDQTGDFFGAQTNRFSALGANPRGIAVNSDGSIWYAESNQETLYKFIEDKIKFDGAESVFSFTFSKPDNLDGLGIDVEDSIWQAGNSGSIYQFDQLGNRLTALSVPGSSPRGVGFDSNNRMWVNTEGSGESIYQVDSGQKKIGVELREK